MNKQAQGAHETIEQAKIAIEDIDKLPEGIEKIEVSILDNDQIQIAFIAKKGYLTPENLVVKFEKQKELIDLNTITLKNFTATNNTVKEDVLRALHEVEGLSDVTLEDFDIKVTKATLQSKGNIIISASEQSKIINGTKEIEIPELQEVEITQKQLDDEIKKITDQVYDDVPNAIGDINENWSLEGTEVEANVPENEASDSFASQKAKISITVTLKPKYVFANDVTVENKKFKKQIEIDVINVPDAN
ncbi:hypothetical protein [Mesoplasma seiffertii]|uniref:hypothetical protein n=1 Tax=Mesoplasma seiffertii TaxID=28224 RepID=UPI000478AF03|nr:hypothetical protein [Mesoplasma seiffertii]